MRVARENLLREGLGVELSQSRHEFAERWKRHDGYGAVENANANFTDVEFGRAKWDWMVVIDNTFTYLHAEDAEYPNRLLEKACEGMRPGGHVLLDFINYAGGAAGVDQRTWAAYAPTDPFVYGLYSMQIADGVKLTESIFIKRDGSEARKIEKSKVYSLTQITSLLKSHGFAMEQVCASFGEDHYVESESERLVVVAGKHD